MEKRSGKTALVTGSTDGVGRLVARKLGQAGARVLVHGRDAERGARVVADIEASGGAAEFLAADLWALAEVRRVADAAQATAPSRSASPGIPRLALATRPGASHRSYRGRAWCRPSCPVVELGPLGHREIRIADNLEIRR